MVREPKFLQSCRGDFLLVEARVTDAGLRDSITLTRVLGYLRPYLQRWQSQGPQASTGQEQRGHSVDCRYLPLRITWEWIRLESYLEKANRCWILCPCSWLYFSILEVRSNLFLLQEKLLVVSRATPQVKCL